MKTCADCGKQVESNYAKFCIDCKILKRKVVAKACKDKYQYHKQPKNRYAAYKRGAESRGYTFELTMEDFSNLWNKPCSYCNEIVPGIGIDRKDNNIGYTASNTISCCTTCNFMKGKLTYTQFVNKCLQISKVFY
jgi:hypothetical protein